MTASVNTGMSVSLSKGQNVPLSKLSDKPLTKLLVNLLWKARETQGTDFDLDASVFVLNDKDEVQDIKDFVYYRNKESVNGAVLHQGDNRIGGGEEVHLDISLLPAYAQKVVFVVTIDEALQRNQSFGQVDGAAIALVDNGTDVGKQLCHFDLTEDASAETAMLFAELYRKNDGWSFRAVGQGHKEGLAAFVRKYGLNPT